MKDLAAYCDTFPVQTRAYYKDYVERVRHYSGSQ